MDDDNSLFHYASQHHFELNKEEDFLDWAYLLTAVLIVGSNEDHVWAVENWCPRRQYLG